LLKKIEMNHKRHINITPDWRAYFWGYFFGILLIPLFGIGVIILWITHKKRTSVHYEIHDLFIREVKNNKSVKIDLLSIENVETEQSLTGRLFRTGTVVIKAAVSEIRITGTQEPHKLADTIQDAINLGHQHLKKQTGRKYGEPDHDPGTLDKMDYLTGLWQQGLISDEDFKKEKKHFES